MYWLFEKYKVVLPHWGKKSNNVKMYNVKIEFLLSLPSPTTARLRETEFDKCIIPDLSMCFSKYIDTGLNRLLYTAKNRATLY